MSKFREMMSEKELTDDKVLAKVAKKMFGGAFDKVTNGTIVELKSEYVAYKDIKAFEINLSTFIIDVIVADKDNIKIWLVKK